MDSLGGHRMLVTIFRDSQVTWIVDSKEKSELLHDPEARGMYLGYLCSSTN